MQYHVMMDSTRGVTSQMSGRMMYLMMPDRQQLIRETRYVILMGFDTFYSTKNLYNWKHS